MAKVLKTKKTVAKKEAVKAPAKETAAKKTAAKKAPAKAATKKTAAKKTVELANITTVNDFVRSIKTQYDAGGYDNNLSGKDIENVYNAFCDALTEFAKKSESEKASFVLPRIGTFKVKICPAHQSINPRNQETVDVPEKKRISFKPFPKFNATMNDED